MSQEEKEDRCFQEVGIIKGFEPEITTNQEAFGVDGPTKQMAFESKFFAKKICKANNLNGSAY